MSDLLVNHGYVRHAGSGVYNMLPLGLAVQTNIESIIRKHLNAVGGAELALTSLSSSALWNESGRLADKSEFFFTNEDKYVLAPTCEEEITALVSETSSYRQLPLRLYQITRKYRDEKRPRGGLLRAKEFVMKDMYSFDETRETALESYNAVQGAYNRIFKELSIPFLVAEADSGSIGGSLSHEYHIMSPSGEDSIVQCDNCGYTANIERAQSTGGRGSSQIEKKYFHADSSGELVVEVRYPADRTLNPLALKQIYPELIPAAMASHNLDSGIKRNVVEDIRCASGSKDATVASVVNVEASDNCIHCGTHHLSLHNAIEVAHTFYLGTKYSRVFKAAVLNRENKRSLMEMGCYGIGVSRLIAGIAEATKDEHGLRWPKSVTPMDAVVISTNESDALRACQMLADSGIRAVWDDRSSQFGLLLGNARAIGFPLAIVLGKKFTKNGMVEIQPRHTTASIFASMENLPQAAQQILDAM